MAKNKKKSDAASAKEGKDLKSILTAPIGGKKKHKGQADPAAEGETAGTTQDAEDETAAKGKKFGKAGKKGAKGKKGAAKGEFTTYDAIRHQKLKLRQEDDIKTFLSRGVMLVVVFVGLFSFLFGFHAQPNNEMAPKISAGDLLLYYRLDKDFKSQDVVVYEKEGKTYCGRVIARPGDSVDISESGGMIVNGSQLIEPEIFYQTYRRGEGVISYPLTLSVNQVFILGDYREGANDSRMFGPVNTAEIKGKVITALRRSGL